MHILLEKEMISTFEDLAEKYSKDIDLNSIDKFKNSAIMIYKELKKK